MRATNSVAMCTRSRNRQGRGGAGSVSEGGPACVEPASVGSVADIEAGLRLLVKREWLQLYAESRDPGKHGAVFGSVLR
jgi:hypothetical protein